MAFIEVPLRKIVFHGSLIGRFGREFSGDAANLLI